MRLVTAAFVGFVCSSVTAAGPCRVEVVESGSGWSVPLVELRTTHQVRFVSDSAGIIAIELPELMGVETWFDVIGHGYEIPRDGFGYRGVRLTPESGKTIRVEVKRTAIARRLGRLTGAGLFAESQRFGQEMDWREAPGIFGCDSVQTAVHDGQLLWFWGDTLVPRYPIGLFDMLGASTGLRPLVKAEPPLRIDFSHLRDESGQPRGVCKMPGAGPTWLSGLVSLPAADGSRRLAGYYIKVKPPLDAHRSGLCVWNERNQSFEPHVELWTRSDEKPAPPNAPEGHATLWKDAAGVDWVLFGNPLPKLKCRATFEAWEDPGNWEILSPQDTLVADDGSGRVKPHTGSIAWHSWRKRWVTIFMEHFGKPSAFGEIWYAEADSPLGPWGPAVKVLSHGNYTFYNPMIHSGWVADDSPVLLFEGTYTATFAKNPPATPRHDYNQILYRLDLDDPALAGAQKR
jgi:hypothetical protein